MKKLKEKIFNFFSFDYELILHLIPIWVSVLCFRIIYFNFKDSTDYGNIKDSLIYPLLATCIAFVILKFIKKGFLYSVVLNQIKVLYVYTIFFITNLDLKYILIYHLVIALFVFVYDFKKHFNIKENITNLILLFFSVLILFTHNTQNGVLSIHNNKPIVDGFSEGISYNSAYYYYSNPSQISKYYFLPVIKYVGEPFHIIQEDPYIPNSSFSSTLKVYTHYPAGSDLINFVLISILGPSKEIGIDPALSLDKFRFFPLIIFIIGFIFFRKFLNITLNNNWLSYLIALLIFLIPAFDRYKLSLYYYSYAFSLMLIMYFVTAKYLIKPKKLLLILLFIMGIVQMWFSFDLLPMILISIFSISFLPFVKNIKSILVKPSIMVLLGFIAGFIMRLFHNNLYFNNWGNTITELINTFLWRSTGTYAGMAPDSFYIEQILRNYNSTYITSNLFFGIQIQVFAFILLVILALLIYKLRVDKYKRLFLYLLLSIVSSYIWVYVMRNHSAIHYFVLTRQFAPMFIAIFITIFILLSDLLSISKKNNLTVYKNDK